MTDFFSVVEGQRAHRAFRGDHVSDDVVATVLATATRAPSAENSQPWVFVVVRDSATRSRIGELTNRAWQSGAREQSRHRLSPALFDAVDAGAGGGVATAPVLVVVGGDTARCHRSALGASVWPAVQNLLLAAEAVGLGAALTTLTTAYAGELAELVAVPDHVRLFAVVPLGFPARPLGPSRRRPLAEVVHRERFGEGW